MVTNSTFAIRCYSYNASLLDRENRIVYLKLALTAKEEIQFLMVFMSVEESCFSTWCKTLERELSTRSIPV